MAEWFEKQRMGDLPKLAAARNGAREALYFKGRRWSYAEFDQEVDRVAKGLLAIGVEPGERVALWMVNRPDWLFINYAVAKIGAVLVPLNTRYRTADVAYTVRQSDSATWITIDRSGPIDFLAMVQENLPALAEQTPGGLSSEDFPALRRVVVVGESEAPGAFSWDDVLAAGEPVDDKALERAAAAVDPDETVIIAYTSGTTGHPKGVMHCHNFLKSVSDRVNRWGVTFEDCVFTSLPVFHLYAYSESVIAAVLTGARQIVTETFDAEETLDLIEAEKATIVHGFDTHYKDLLDAQERKVRDISSMRFGTFPAGGMSSAPIAWRTQKELFPTVSGWGMTETWAFTTCSFANSTDEQRCEASGFPMPGIELRVIDPVTGKDVPTGEQGELLLRGFTLTKGYYKKPEQTAEAIDADGWMHTGDTAQLRADGHMQFIGRFKDMLKVGGENVSPAEIEAYVMALPAVDQIAVVGYPDPRLAEVPVAFVVPSAGQTVALDDVIAHCKGKIASYKIPRHVVTVDALPMTPTGKVQKHKLRDQALAELGAPSNMAATGD